LWALARLAELTIDTRGAVVPGEEREIPGGGTNERVAEVEQPAQPPTVFDQKMLSMEIGVHESGEAICCGRGCIYSIIR
jgi:hypothetical protein